MAGIEKTINNKMITEWNGNKIKWRQWIRSSLREAQDAEKKIMIKQEHSANNF